MGNSITLIVGRSASGKTSAVEYLERVYGMTRVVSYTTRPLRENENPNEHIFVSDEEFDKIMSEDIAVAYTNYGDYRYCATKSQADKADLYIIDPHGVLYFKHFYKGDKNINIVYIDTDPHVCYNRLIKEGYTHEEAIKRMARNEQDYTTYLEYDIKIDGDNDVECVGEMIKQFIDSRE